MEPPSGFILPVSYFPPLSYFACFFSGGDILIETGETFPKQTFRNRCEIAAPTGKQILVVPVQKPNGNHTRTFEALVSTHQDWRTRHWRAIETAYSSSPFFIYYSDPLKKALFDSTSSLAGFNLQLIDELLMLLGSPGQYSLSEGYLKDTGDWIDLRGAFSKKKQQLQLSFTPYLQVFSQKHGFLEDLSVLDLLFNLGPESPAYLSKLSETLRTSFSTT